MNNEISREDVERVARAMAKFNGHNPDEKVLRPGWDPYIDTLGFQHVDDSFICPFWYVFYDLAYLAANELKERPLGWEPAPEPSEDMIDPNLPGFDINPQPAPETLERLHPVGETGLPRFESIMSSCEALEQSWKERMGLA